MEIKEATWLDSVLKQPSGMILVTGPTGSGKTTTLYAILQALNSEHVNIITAEDPVEYKLSGITQVNCDTEDGLTFSRALRSFLRQDPDVIMVGEIRDRETADMALKASMTGHLVFSTLHTNDASSAINRLVNMGIPAYLVASAQVTVIAQRLVRKICHSCKTRDEKAGVFLKHLNTKRENGEYFIGRGCPECAGTGYRGRIGIYEMLRVDDNMVPIILAHEPSATLKNAAIAAGMTTLRDAAIMKLEEGLTTVEEVIRVTMD
jgi:type IV pilus assembly protein PilB